MEQSSCKWGPSRNPCLSGTPADIPQNLLILTFISGSHYVFQWSQPVTCEWWIEIYWLRFSTLALVVHEQWYPRTLYNPSLRGAPGGIPFLYLHSFPPWSFQMVQSSYKWVVSRSLLVQISILGTLCHAPGSSHCKLKEKVIVYWSYNNLGRLISQRISPVQ